MKTMIKNGRVVKAVDDYVADIFIDGETVTMIGKTLDVEADVVIDALGKLVIPGGIDPHTHMELPFGGTQASDDFLGMHQRIIGRKALADCGGEQFVIGG